MRKTLIAFGLAGLFLGLLLSSPQQARMQELSQIKASSLSSRAGESKHITLPARQRKNVSFTINRELYPDGATILVRLINQNPEGEYPLASELLGTFRVNQSLVEFSAGTEFAEASAGGYRLFDGGATGFDHQGNTGEIAITLDPDNQLNPNREFFRLPLELDFEINNPAIDGTISVNIANETLPIKKALAPRSASQLVTGQQVRESAQAAAGTCQNWPLYSPQYFRPVIGLTILEGKTLIGSPTLDGMKLFDISNNYLLIKQILNGGVVPTPVLAPDRLADQQFQAFQLSFVSKGIPIGSLLYHTHTDDVALSCYNIRSTVVLSTGYRITPDTTLAELQQQLRFGMYEYRYGFTRARYNDLGLVGGLFKSLPKIR